MSDNPFAEPEDDNRTVIRPTPGRRRAQPAVPPGQAGGEQPPRSDPPAARPVAMAEGTENTAIGEDALTAAAAPLLQLMARLRNTANPPDSGDLRERTVRQGRIFQPRGAEKGGTPGQLCPAPA